MIKSRRWIQSAVLLAGFNALAAQILFLREFFILFHGGELAIGFLLACWLGWTALGSYLGGKLFSGTDAIKTWSILHLLQALFLPLTLLIISSNRLISQAIPGESLSIEQSMIFAILETSIFCIASGMLFSVGSHLYAKHLQQKKSTSSSRIYLYETLGGGLAGILVTIFLAFHLDDIILGALISVINLLYLYAFISGMGYQKHKYWIVSAFWILTIFLCTTPVLKSGLIEQGWQPFKIKSKINGKFGEWIVIKLENEYTFYQNGLATFTLPDPAGAEENAHYALLQHPDPENILMIGGGLNGGLVEALKHPSIKSITYVELDPQLLSLIQDLNLPYPNDPRIKIFFEDGRHFLQKVEETFDVIICNTPDPDNAQLNRFFTKEFFCLARKHLNEGGLLALKVEGFANYINDEQAKYLASLNLTLKTVFAEVGYLPGDVIHFFASDSAERTAPSANLLAQRLREREIETTFVREYYIPFRLTPDRIESLRQAITIDDPSLLNYDMFPKTYYLNSLFRGSKFMSPMFSLIKSWSQFHVIILLAGFVVLLILISFMIKPMNRFAGISSVFTMGFTVMGLEVALLIAFQSLFGYVYYQLAMMAGMMLLGMATGVWITLKYRKMLNLAYLELLLTLLTTLVALFYFIVKSNVLQSWMMTNQLTGGLLFFAIAFLCGGLGGIIFPVATSIYFKYKNEKSSNIGLIYSTDLGGALLGSILPASFLFPLIGLANTMLFLIGINVVTILILIIRGKTIY